MQPNALTQTDTQSWLAKRVDCIDHLDRRSAINTVLTRRREVGPVLLARMYTTMNGWIIIVIADVD